MDVKIKKQWIKALRSGKYKQTRGRLKGDGGFCCLGVLCDVLGEHMNYEVAKDHGVTLDEIEILYGMNDGTLHHHHRKHSFPEIADWIEENL